MPDRIPIVVEVMQLGSAEVAAYEDCTYLDDEGKPSDFMWADGNYSCDCNRSLEWHRAQGLPEPEPGYACGMEDYWVRLTRLDSGEVFYDEFEDIPKLSESE